MVLPRPMSKAATEYPWQVYYMADGKLEAHFQRIAARVPHGPMEDVDFVEFGTWRLDDEHNLCQTIPKVGWGTEVCYYLDRRGNRMAMYYETCGAFYRCYPGRLGPGRRNVSRPRVYQIVAEIPGVRA